jgi:hypothetical protein
MIIIKIIIMILMTIIILISARAGSYPIVKKCEKCVYLYKTKHSLRCNLTSYTWDAKLKCCIRDLFRKPLPYNYVKDDDDTAMMRKLFAGAETGMPVSLKFTDDAITNMTNGMSVEIDNCEYCLYSKEGYCSNHIVNKICHNYQKEIVNEQSE